jgi:hypothetical protein
MSLARRSVQVTRHALAARQSARARGPDRRMRAGLELLPTWVLEQKATAKGQVIGVMRRRLAAGEAVARMYQEPGLAWLEPSGGRREPSRRTLGRQPGRLT